MELKLWKHQETGRVRCLDRDFHMLTMQIGTGKTATLIRTYADKCTKHQTLLPLLIFSPPITLNNWKNEFAMWMKIPESQILVLKGPLKKRVSDLEKAMERYGSELVIITNYEAMVQKNKDLFIGLKKFCASNENTFLCLDESHRVKSSTSKTSKALYTLSQFCHYKFLLTGTPVLNSELDLFMQFKIMAPHIFGKSIMTFRARYFTNIFANVAHMSFPKYEIKPEMIPELNEILNKHSYKVLKETCLDLPPLVKERYEVELGAEQKKIYNQMKKDFVAFLHGTLGKNNDPVHVVANLVITQALRLQQIVTGFIKDEAGEEHLFKKNPRAEVLRDLLAEIAVNNKVIVWAIFRKNYEIIANVCRDLGIKYVEVHGSVSDKNKMQAVEDFNNGDAQVLIGNPGSAGIGINLVASNYSIYYSRNFSLEFDLQSEGRNYRGGSDRHERVTRIDLVTPNTIDEDVLTALEGKLSMAERVSMLKEKYK